MPLEHDGDFQGSFFGLDIDGMKMTYFTACSGISLEFEPINFKTLHSPGFGGRFYYMWDEGFVVLQPMPAAAQ